MMATRFESLFSPYLSLRLAAFDNMKLIAAVLSDANETYQCVEASLQTPSVGVSRASYFVRWNDAWLYCGFTNAYDASICLFTELERINMASVSLITVPIMSMQQVSFMCIESAHFDHC